MWNFNDTIIGDENMDSNDSWGFETWAQLSDLEKIKQFILYRGFKMIQSSSINDIFVHDNFVISIRKLRNIESEIK